MIEESYVSFETARLMEKAGFDCPCEWSYNEVGKLSVTYATNSTLPKGHVSRPTLALAERWLREVHGIHVFPVYQYLPEKWSYVIQDMTYVNSEKGTKLHTDVFNSCEEALEAGLKRGLKLIKNQEL